MISNAPDQILVENPKLSFAERQELVRRTIELEHEEITHPKRKRFLTNALQIFPDSPIFVFSLHQS